MRAEVVALGLGEVGRQALAPVRIEVGERRRVARHRNAKGDGGLHEEAPRVLAPLDRVTECLVEQQVDEIRIPVVRAP